MAKVELTGNHYRRDKFPIYLTKKTGTQVDLDTGHWLNGPYGDTGKIGKDFFERLAASTGSEFFVNSPGAGLIPDFQQLKNPDFDPARVDPAIVDFYERTADYHLDLRTRWSRPFRPLGRALHTVYTGRIEQMNIPTRRSDESGLSSEIQQIVDPTTSSVNQTAWVRTHEDSGKVLYAGSYSVAQLDSGLNVVKVVFPLPDSNASVLLKPVNKPDGSFELVSAGEKFGDPGFYFVAQESDTGNTYARYVRNMKQRIHVYKPPEKEGPLLLTDHSFHLGGGHEFLNLRYNISHKN